MKIFEILTEDRDDWIKSNQALSKNLELAAQNDTFYRGEKDVTSILNSLKEVDPENGKNIVWLARMYAARQFRMEDLNQLKTDIGLFIKNKAKIPNKDLNSYKSIQDLRDAIEPFVPKQELDPEYQEYLSKFKSSEQGASEIEDLAKFGSQKVLIKTPNFLVTIPLDLKTSKAFCKLHGTTSWCTAHEDMYKSYSSKGPLYDIFVKVGNKLRKFQFHVEDGQYKNEKDADLTSSEIKLLSAIPEYTNFLNYLIKKHYGKYFADK